MCLACRSCRAARSPHRRTGPARICRWWWPATRYWQRTGFDPGLVGQTMRVNERAFTVIGITPRGFSGTMSVVGRGVVLPARRVPHAGHRVHGCVRALAPAGRRLQPVPGRAAEGRRRAEHRRRGPRAVRPEPGAELPGRARSTTSCRSAPLPKFGTSTSPSDESVLGTLGVVMMGMTAAVLLTVCLNLASMLLARGRARRKEFAIRLAIGGGRARIVRQLLVEGLLLSLVGRRVRRRARPVRRRRADGVAVGDPADHDRARRRRLARDRRGRRGVLRAGDRCSSRSVPRCKHSRADILSDLKVQSGDDPAPRRWRLVPRNPLVAAQVALSLCLLIAAALFFRMALGSATHGLGVSRGRDRARRGRCPARRPRRTAEPSPLMRGSRSGSRPCRAWPLPASARWCRWA